MPRRALLTLLAIAGLPAAIQAQTRLEQEIARIAPASGGKVGVGLIHIESGKSIYVNGDDQFPLASTYKVAIAVTAFKLVEEGKLSLDQMITIEPTDIHISDEWAGVFQAPGVSLSLRNVIEPMLIFSENSATDKMLGLVGGGAAVTARMRSLGIEGIRVDRTTADIISQPMGVPDVWTDGKFDRGKWERGIAAVSPARRDSAAWYYARDPRDHASPRAMVGLLARLWKGDILNREHTAYMLDIMTRCRTGKARIKGMLPPGTKVAHKTGTYPGTTNDVGIIDLPDGTHLAIAVFVKESTKIEGPALESTIAQIARAAYDYFLYSGGM